MALTLHYEKIRNKEMIHYADDHILISSMLNRVTIDIDGNCHIIILPLPILLRVLGVLRLVRRILRLDKSSVIIAQDRSTVVITYRNTIFCYDLKERELKATGTLQQCRTVMHMSIAALSPQTFIIGEYGGNPDRKPVPVHVSIDGGKQWHVPYYVEGIRHIHGVYHDPYTDHIWISTGDFEGECYLYEFPNINFQNPVIHGDGSQVWRTVNLFFTEDKVIWGMDSQLETSFLVTMRKDSGQIAIGRSFPGPIWYIKTLSDGFYLVQTTVEKGAGVLSNKVHIFMTRDFNIWEEIAAFPHDGLPLGLCKNAVIAFANGAQSSEEFYFSAEAIRCMDGKSYKCKIVEGDARGS